MGLVALAGVSVAESCTVRPSLTEAVSGRVRPVAAMGLVKRWMSLPVLVLQENSPLPYLRE
jgi:hypothetical protein